MSDTTSPATSTNPNGFPPAPPAPLDKVQWRAQGNPSSNGRVLVVPYLEVPTVSELLDEWVGPFGWWDEYQQAGDGVMWCKLTIAHPVTGVERSKRDVGTASNYEPEKGLVSDAFKRVAMRKWRVGHNVYDLPNLWIRSYELVRGSNNRDQVRLTRHAKDEIKALLKRQGFDEAAEKTRVDVDVADDTADGSGPDEPTSIADYHRSQQVEQTRQAQQQQRRPPAARQRQSAPRGGDSSQQPPAGQQQYAPHQLAVAEAMSKLPPARIDDLRRWWAEQNMPVVKRGDNETRPNLHRLDGRQAAAALAKITELADGGDTEAPPAA